jgi:hypothetical protein
VAYNFKTGKKENKTAYGIWKYDSKSVPAYRNNTAEC